ncbi:hypothetical protein ACVIJ6_001472 [Bradyrhizobium sp. USDA 4369]
MAILSPEHLFGQAEQLILPTVGPPRQVNIRRAISAAYYGLFHATLTAAADQFIGASKRTTNLYALVYRTVDHRGLRVLCEEVKKSSRSSRYLPYEPSGGFGAQITAFAVAALELQEKRHEADYNPMIRMRSLDAQLAIAAARAALTGFEAAAKPSREAFLTLLLFPPRAT